MTDFRMLTIMKARQQGGTIRAQIFEIYAAITIICEFLRRGNL